MCNRQLGSPMSMKCSCRRRSLLEMDVAVRDGDCSLSVAAGTTSWNTLSVAHLETELRVPVWQMRDVPDTYNVVYTIAAIVIHRENTPYSDHYQACLLQDQQLFITDDNKLPGLSSRQRELMSIRIPTFSSASDRSKPRWTTR